MNLVKCPVCQSPSQIQKNPSLRQSLVQCYRCGEFTGDDDPLRSIKNAKWSEVQIATASGYIRRNQGLHLSSEAIEQLAGLRTPTPAEKASRLLLFLGQESSRPGLLIRVSGGIISEVMRTLEESVNGDVYPENTDEKLLEPLTWLGISCASDGNEVKWLLENSLIGEGYLKDGRQVPYSPIRGIYSTVVITPLGWREIERLQQVNTGSRTGFVAMRFNDEFQALFDQGIEPGIRAAGYEAFRIDRKEHNNRIDDEIIASIKQSRFLVADFTEDRGGIYFEAGFAMGLGLPVIWITREDQLGGVHFDNRQYNFITWRAGEWDEMVKRLRFRIEATVGLGPLARRERF